MKNTALFDRRLKTLGFGLFLSFCTFGAVSATTIEVLSVQRSSVTLKIDGRAPRVVSAGDLTPEGIYLRGISKAGDAQLRIRGVEETVGVGRILAAAANVAGLPTLTIPKDVEGRFLAQFLANGQPFQVEVDPKRPGGLVMPVADAERMRLPYKDEPQKAGEPKKKLEFPKPQRFYRKGKPYFNHFAPIKNVKVGGIDLFGVQATVSEDPEVKRAVAGRGFLLLMDASWEGSTMTVRRLP